MGGGLRDRTHMHMHMHMHIKVRHMFRRGLRTEGGATSSEVEANIDPEYCLEALEAKRRRRDSHLMREGRGEGRGEGRVV